MTLTPLTQHLSKLRVHKSPAKGGERQVENKSKKED
jgi:hypothetical protein